MADDLQFDPNFDPATEDPQGPAEMAHDAGYGWAWMCDQHAKAKTTGHKHLWEHAVKNWKANAQILRSLGRPLPPKPDPSPWPVVAVDFDLAMQRYMESYHTKQPIVEDYWIITPRALAANEFDIDTDTDAKPQPEKPYSIVSKQKYSWQIAAGDKLPAGSPYTDPKIGPMKKIAIPGFGGVIQFFWQAKTAAGVAVWSEEFKNAFGYDPEL